MLEDRRLNNHRAKGGCEFNIWLRLGSLVDPTVIKVVVQVVVDVVVHSESNMPLSVLGGEVRAWVVSLVVFRFLFVLTVSKWFGRPQ